MSNKGAKTMKIELEGEPAAMACLRKKPSCPSGEGPTFYVIDPASHSRVKETEYLRQAKNTSYTEDDVICQITSCQ